MLDRRVRAAKAGTAFDASRGTGIGDGRESSTIVRGEQKMTLTPFFFIFLFYTE